MAFRVGPLAVGAGFIVAAGIAAFFRSERAPEPTPSPHAESPAAQASESAHAPPSPPPAQMPNAPDRNANGEPPIVWTVPTGWQSVPNPNGMRLATYAIPDSSAGENAEVSVSRAGGSTEANIQRWQGQFADPDQARRGEKTVRGLNVTLVEMSGTYSSGGMTMPGAGSITPHAGWALVAAIVPVSDSSYFFKMVGPAAKVRAARKSFDALVDSLGPR